jgi:holliday junction DNA helicase RuvA
MISSLANADLDREMIDYLSGILAGKREDAAVVDVGGVGFRATIPISTYRELPRVGEAIQLHTVLIVREDDMQLYGFASDSERELFNLLLSLNGVGAKMAVDIISHLTVERLIEAVRNEQPALLTQVPGIGKKRAEKLIFDLKRIDHPILYGLPGAATGESDAPIPSSAATQDALDGLVALGMKPMDAQRALREAMQHVGEESGASALIKEALRHR